VRGKSTSKQWWARCSTIFRCRRRRSPNSAAIGLLVNAVTDYAIYMLDPNGKITSWNPGARRLKCPFREAGKVRFRRVSPVAVRPGQGPLTEPTAVTQA